MKHRSVVANFIFSPFDATQPNPQVALFRRSKHPNIRSYQDKYAPISGSIDEDDANPIAAARREILEETQLVADRDVYLEFTGPSYSFEDSEAQRSWTVHPFGWILTADESKIKIDWEHSGWRWFNPAEVLNGSLDNESVPRLGESLRRVYFGPGGMFFTCPLAITRVNAAGGIFVDTLNDLKTDTENGARVLATKGLVGLQQMTQELSDESDSPTQVAQKWHDLKVAAYQFIHSARPSMSSAIEAAIVDCMHQVFGRANEGNLELRAAVQTFEKCINNRKSTIERIARQFTSYVKQMRLDGDEKFNLTIFTLSSSSTVIAALTHLLQSSAPVATLSVIVLESRPRCEGASLASSLICEWAPINTSSSNYPMRLNIQVAPDSHAALLLRRLSSTDKAIVLLGADRITPLMNISNKTGSANLAVLAKALVPNQVQVVVLSEEEKIAKAAAASLDDYNSLLNDTTDQALRAYLFQRLSGREIKAESHEKHDADEVCGAWPTEDRMLLLLLHQDSQNQIDHDDRRIHLHIDNTYFEFVPRDSVNVFISENGTVSRENVLRIAVERTKLEQEIFGDMCSTDDETTR